LIPVMRRIVGVKVIERQVASTHCRQISELKTDRNDSNGESRTASSSTGDQYPG